MSDEDDGIAEILNPEEPFNGGGRGGERTRASDMKKTLHTRFSSYRMTWTLTRVDWGGKERLSNKVSGDQKQGREIAWAGDEEPKMIPLRFRISEKYSAVGERREKKALWPPSPPVKNGKAYGHCDRCSVRVSFHSQKKVLRSIMIQDHT